MTKPEHAIPGDDDGPRLLVRPSTSNLAAPSSGVITVANREQECYRHTVADWLRYPTTSTDTLHVWPDRTLPVVETASTT